MPGFYGMCSPKGLMHYPTGHLSAAACAKLGATARKMPSWKAYRDATKNAPAHIYTPRATRATLAGCDKARAKAISSYKREVKTMQKRMDAERTAAMLKRANDARWHAAETGSDDPRLAQPHHTLNRTALPDVPCTMLRGTPCNKCRTHTTTRKAALAALRA